MKIAHPKPTVTLFFFLFVFSATAQINKFYADHDSPVSGKKQSDVTKDFKKFRLIKQDIPSIESFRKTFSVSPNEINNSNNVITIPLEDGRDVLFNISPVQTLSQESSLIFSQIKTYSGLSQDSTMKLRLTISQLGIMGTVRIKDEGAVHYFTILDNQQPDILISFNSLDVISPLAVMCGTNELSAMHDAVNSFHPSRRTAGDCTLRTYRFAVAATGEYTQWAATTRNSGNPQADAAAYITTTVNNVNEVYENDFTIRLSLVLQMANIYTNPDTDPFTGSLDNNMLIQNNSTLNINTGVANYDVGMLFGYGPGWSGGIAGVGVTCSSGKGRGAGGLNSGFTLGSRGPIFDNIIAHELGHQFSAGHTMAANNGSCNGNVNVATGWEPGGGSTIMAYAGSCSGNAYQSQSDNYFHGGSIAQVLNYVVNGDGRTCAALSSSGNNAPIVNVAQLAYDIPYGTPFVLTANATDVDAGDVLTYSWEQMDAIGGIGISTPPVATATEGPLFRSHIAITSPARYFPPLPLLLIGGSDAYEVLPSVARALNFKVTVRDNHEGAGCTAYENVNINVQNCGAFEITNLNTASVYISNGTNTMTLNWNTASCVAMSNIDVLFSTDGGVTYPHAILSATPNDGTETFFVPNISTCKGRFMIKSISNIYYNINAADITITSACTANGTTISPSTDFLAPGAGDASLNLSETPVYGAAISQPITGSITSADLAGNLSIYDESTSACSGPSNNNNFDTIVFYPSVSGSYTFRLTAPFGIVTSLYEDSYQSNNVCENFMASSAIKRTGNTLVSLGDDVTATFCAGLKYVLVVSSFGSSTPSLPANYSINIISAPAGGQIFTGQKNPLLNYNYIIVDNNNNNVVEVKSEADLTDYNKYTSNRTYTIYGVSSSTAATTLSTDYAGESFNKMRTDILGQVGGLCAQLSANSRRVMIGNVVLPAKLISFNALLLSDQKASLVWKVAFEYDVRAYTVERSIDGGSFTALGNTAPFNMNTSVEQIYSYTDETIPVNAGKIVYRIKIEDIDGKTEYTSIISLQLNRKWSARIYPNPIQHASLDLFINALSADNTVLQIVDISGRVVINKQARLNKGSNKIQIPVQHLSNGMYLLRIKGQTESGVLHFIKR